jgi:hypothetical protein
MSAFHSIADIHCGNRNVCFGPNSDIAPHSLNHLVGAGNQRLGHGDTERLGGSLVDYQLHRRGLLNWQIRWLFAFEDAARVVADSPKTLGEAGPVTKKTACNSKLTKLIDGRDRVTN